MLGVSTRWQTVKHWLSPANTMLLTLLLIILVQLSAVTFLTRQPWTGLQLGADFRSGFLYVKSVADHSPASGEIHAGQILVAMQFEGREIPLDAKLFGYPPYMRQTHAKYRKSLDLEAELHKPLISGKSFTLITSSGSKHNLTTQIRTPLGALSAEFWFFSLLYTIIPLIGALVWSRKPFTRESALLITASLSHYGLFVLDTICFSKDISLGYGITHRINVTQLTVLNIFIACIFALMSTYPHKLLNNKILYLFALFILFFPLNLYFSWIDLPISNFFFSSLPPFIVCSIFGQIQINRSSDPIQRTAAKVIQFSIIVPYVPIFLLFLIPLIIGIDPFLDIRVVRIAAVIIFIGLAIGIIRYRLFQVEYWWLKSWLWLLGGTAIMLLDIALIALFNTSQVYALGLSVILTGFLYFPLRQWLLVRLLPTDNSSVQDFLPTLSTLITGAASSADFEQRWQQVLQQRFNPLNLETQLNHSTKPLLSENGLHLNVPALSGSNSYRLTGKQMGARLFSTVDIQTVEALRNVIRIASNASANRQQAVLKERQRIMHDLHDTVGARLLTLMQGISSPEQRRATQNILQTLRDIIHLTLQKSPVLLGEHLADWRAETIEHTDRAGIELCWQTDPQLETIELPPRRVIDAALFIRQTLEKVIEQPSQRLQVSFTLKDQRLLICFNSDRDASIQCLISTEYHPNG